LRAATDVPELLRAYAGGDRQAAVVAVGKLDDSLYYQGGWVCPAASAALPFLVRLAADPEVKVRVMVHDRAARWDVVISLGAAAAGSALAGEVRGELSGLARDGRDPQVRLAAVHGLAAAGEPVTGHAGVMAGAMADAGWTGWEASEWLGGGSPEMIVRESGRLLLDEPGPATAFAADVMNAGDARQRTEALMHMGALLGRWHATARGHRR
jgi:hypothetical protein